MRTTLLISVFVAAVRCLGQSQMLSILADTDYVTVPHSPSQIPQTGLTVEAWFRFDPGAPGGTDNPTILRKDPGTHPYFLRTSLGSGGAFQWGVWTTTSGFTGFDSGTVPVLSWHHVAGTYDGTMMRVFLDGVQIGAMPKSGPLLTTTGPLLIARGNAPDETWRGNLDEVRIWSTARSAAAIQSTMNIQVDNAPSLISAWHFNGSFVDLTGGNNGTPVGTATLVPSTAPVNPLQLVAPLSAGFGTSISYMLTGAAPTAGYVLEVSASGTTPGIPLPPPLGNFPLNQPLLFSSYGAALPGVFVGFSATTNALGTANAMLNLPALPALVGTQLSAAFVYLDAVAPLGIGGISPPVTTTVSNPPPIVALLTPATAPTTGGWRTVVQGSYFESGATVRIGLSYASNVVFIDGSTLTCTTPPGQAGTVDVVVTNPSTLAGTLVGGFTYVAPLSLASVSPLIAPPGSPITITGSGFQTGATVKVGTVAAAVNSITSNSIVFSNPGGAPCNTTVTVTNPDAQTGYLPFNPAPSIIGTVGNVGPAAGGGAFFILGGTFVPGTTVSVGGNPGVILSQTQSILHVQAPPGPAATVPVVVTTPNGCVANTTYTYQ